MQCTRGLHTREFNIRQQEEARHYESTRRVSTTLTSAGVSTILFERAICENYPANAVRSRSGMIVRAVELK
jgi:hypothetical protein